MENSVNIIEVANYCKNEFEQKCNKSDNMSDYSIYYIAIYDDEKIKISLTPHILAAAHKCYLVHKWKELSCNYWYDTYEVQSINIYGEVGSGYFDNEYSISISGLKQYSVSEIELRRNNNIIYSARFCCGSGSNALTKKLEYVWELYKKCKNETKTVFESKLLCKIASKDETIHDLENRLAELTLKEQYIRDEIGEYRNLLDKITSIIKTDI